MESGNRQTVIILLLVANLALVYFMGSGLMNRMDRLDNDVNNMTHQIETAIWRESDNIIDGVVESIITASSPIEGITVKIKGIDPDKLEAEVDVTAFMREVNPENTLKLVITDNRGQTHETMLVYKESLVRKGTVRLDITKDYQMDISESGDDGTKVLTASSEPLNLRSQYYENRIKGSSGSGSGSNKGISEERVFELEILSEEVMGLESVEMSILVNGEVQLTRDVTDEVVTGKNPDDVREQMLALKPDYAGATEGSMGHGSSSATTVAVPEQKYIEKIEAESIYYLMHFVSILYKDYDYLDSGSNIDFSYRFTFKDGHVEMR